MSKCERREFCPLIIETPYGQYQRLPPRRKFIRSVIGAVLLPPLGVVGLWYLEADIALIALVTIASLFLGIFQAWTTYHEWKAAPDTVPVRDPSVYSVPAVLLLFGAAGLLCFMGALFVIAETGRANPTLLWLSGALVAPAVLHFGWAFWKHGLESGFR